MDAENGYKCETLEGAEAAASRQEETDPVRENVDGIVPSETAESDSERVKGSVDAPGEEAIPSGPEDTSGNAVGSTASNQDVTEQPVSHQESVVFDIDVDDVDDGTSRLNLETPEREEDGSTRGEEEEEVEQTADSADQDDDHASYEEHLRLHQELCEERDEAIARGAQLQSRLAEHFRRNAPDEGRLERGPLESEQLEGYESHLHLLSEMRRRLSAASESAQQQQAEQLRLQCQEKQEKVHPTTGRFGNAKCFTTVLCASILKTALCDVTRARYLTQVSGNTPSLPSEAPFWDRPHPPLPNVRSIGFSRKLKPGVLTEGFEHRAKYGGDLFIY